MSPEAPTTSATATMRSRMRRPAHHAVGSTSAHGKILTRDRCRATRLCRQRDTCTGPCGAGAAGTTAGAVSRQNGSGSAVPSSAQTRPAARRRRGNRGKTAAPPNWQSVGSSKRHTGLRGEPWRRTDIVMGMGRLQRAEPAGAMGVLLRAIVPKPADYTVGIRPLRLWARAAPATSQTTPPPPGTSDPRHSAARTIAAPAAD